MATFDWTPTEDTNFVVGDSPKVITAAAPYADGYIACDGTGSIQVEIAPEDTSYGSAFTIKANEVITLSGSRVSSIRLTHTGTDSAYRVLVVPVNPIGR